MPKGMVDLTRSQRRLARVGRIERRLIRLIPRLLRPAYFKLVRLVFRGLRLHRVRFPTSSSRWGTMLVDRVDTVNSYLYLFQVWEPAVTVLIERHLDEGDVFVDVGANIGYFSLLASGRVGSTGKVYAIEALPAVFERLTDHLRLNGIENVKALNRAVWDSYGTQTVYRGPPTNVGSTKLRASKTHVAAADIRSAPLLDLVDESDIGRIKIIKIDVEGSEPRVVAGLAPHLDRLRQDLIFVIEVSPELLGPGESIDGILSPFHEHGFRFFVIPNDYSYRFYLDYRHPSGFEELPFEQLRTDRENRYDLAICRDAPRLAD